MSLLGEPVDGADGMTSHTAGSTTPLVAMTVEEINVMTDRARKLPPTGDQTSVLQADSCDPWVISHEGELYSVAVDQPAKRKILVSRLAGLTDMDSAPAVEVWPAARTDVPEYVEIWAPELHLLDGRWYLYFGLYNGNFGNERIHVAEGTSTDPQGEYAYKGSLTVPTDRWSIDGTVMDIDGTKYLVWSGWEGFENESQNLYIARMSNPWTVVSDRVCISRPEYEWERNGYPYINEGPQALQRDGRLFMIYSASGSWTDDYCLGQLTFLGGDPLDPSSWRKEPQPVFQRSESIVGTGHACFVNIEGEDWLIYHAARSSGAGWARQVRAKKYTWNPDGTPHFGTPS